jgi:hypothetical protein
MKDSQNTDHHHHASSSSSPTTTRPLHVKNKNKNDGNINMPLSNGTTTSSPLAADDERIILVDHVNNAIADAYDNKNDQDDIHSSSLRSSSSSSSSWQTTCRTLVTILVWYGISDTIILITKWLFQTHFPFPLTVTFYSNMMSFVWAFLVSKYLCCCRQRNRQQQHQTTTTTTSVSKHQFWNFVVPIGLCTALEIGSSNLALKLLTVSFGTILKGSSPVFTFGWGLFFGIESLEWKIGLSLSLIAFGIALASLGEITGHGHGDDDDGFEVFGFCLQLFAMMMGGLR